MRTGISLDVSPADRRRLEALVRDRNSPQKHVWRARIVLATADGLGTMAIMRATAKSKTSGVALAGTGSAEEGVAGLLRDKTRPSRVKPFRTGRGRADRCPDPRRDRKRGDPLDRPRPWRRRRA